MTIIATELKETYAVATATCVPCDEIMTISMHSHIYAELAGGHFGGKEGIYDADENRLHACGIFLLHPGVLRMPAPGFEYCDCNMCIGGRRPSLEGRLSE